MMFWMMPSYYLVGIKFKIVHKCVFNLYNQRVLTFLLFYKLKIEETKI